MRLPHPVFVTLFAGAAAAVAVAIGACSNPDTQSPTCDENADQSGIHPDPDGCYGFAVCSMGPPSACCVGEDGGALTGNDLATCLHGFGDSSCPYLLVAISGDGGDSVAYTCSTTPGGDSDGGATDGG